MSRDNSVKTSLYVRLEAKPGKEKEVASFLEDGLALANKEPKTIATGQAPHRYLLELRLRKAQSMVANHSLHLIEIAAACGFQAMLTCRQPFGHDSDRSKMARS